MSVLVLKQARINVLKGVEISTRAISVRTSRRAYGEKVLQHPCAGLRIVLLIKSKRKKSNV